MTGSNDRAIRVNTIISAGSSTRPQRIRRSLPSEERVRFLQHPLKNSPQQRAGGNFGHPHKEKTTRTLAMYLGRSASAQAETVLA